MRQTVERLVNSVPESSKRFRDVDIINTKRPLHPRPTFFMTSGGVRIDTIVAVHIHPLADDSSDWGFFDRFHSNHVGLPPRAAITTFSLESLGIQNADFSDNSEKTVAVPDACSILLVQEGLSHLYGNQSFKHSDQYSHLEEHRRRLCSGDDHAELEKSIREVKRYRELCPPPTRNRIKGYIGSFAPHLLQKAIDGRVGDLYRAIKGSVIEPTLVEDLRELLS